jgi:flagellar hook protein FlgE
MAINGNGFFKVEKIDQSTTYTRDGSFQLDKEGYIINANGDKLIGFLPGAPNAQVVLQIDTEKDPPQVTTSAQIKMNLPAEAIQIADNLTFSPITTGTYNNTTASVVYDPRGVAKVIQSYYRYEDIKTKTGTVAGSVFTLGADVESAGLKVGQRITYEGIEDDTFISSISGDQITVTTAFEGTPTTINVLPHWEAYVYNGTSEIAKLNLYFGADGTLDKDLTHVADTELLDLDAWTPATGQLTFGVEYSYYEEEGGALTTGNFELDLDFTNATEFAGDFTALSTQTGGYPPGVLLGISVERDGSILARYGNGQQQTQAQVMLANFKNPNGLEVARDNQFLSTLASGEEQAGTPGQYGTGAIEGSSVEQSNVDLTGEMIKLIAAQRNYQAVAQLIKKQDEVLQTAINIGQ